MCDGMQGWGRKNRCKYDHVPKYVLTRDVNKIVIQRTPQRNISTSVLNMRCISFCLVNNI